jgi:hypothetical protein
MLLMRPATGNHQARQGYKQITERTLRGHMISKAEAAEGFMLF